MNGEGCRSILEELNSKSGMLIQRIAEELLFVEPGERIPKIEDLSKKYNVGRGTVQNVLKKMDERQCIALESRGHLGTFLRSKDLSMLLAYCGSNSIVGVMPLPYSKKYEGLATALHEEFGTLNLSYHSAFMQGATVRLDNIMSGRYDFALVSRFAAMEAISKHKELKIAKEFGLHSYVSEHALVFSEAANGIQDGMKVGIDSDSIDQKALTLAEVKDKRVEYVNVNYMHLLKHLKAKTIDAMIWNVDEIDDASLHVAPLTAKESLAIAQQMSQAVCVIHQDNKKIEYLFRIISDERITALQYEVEAGRRIPKY
ncbi:GntR family transcriptional regulator YhfZ [Paenibacillus elgii]|uniref:GntR family transcriptional regulator YhfZ n=1 Tax=Paenibacillus elgii TaxID=189691 RepID=UPI002559F282|nr:GntR family transcriptional regulator YhfZ [Paenibacillus elgii]